MGKTVDWILLKRHIVRTYNVIGLMAIIYYIRLYYGSNLIHTISPVMVFYMAVIFIITSYYLEFIRQKRKTSLKRG